jgi:hypothetical protein
MVETKVNGKTTIVPATVTNPDLVNVKIGTSRTDSETQNITPVFVPCKGINNRETVAILCDAPGFSDTRGVEIDISNAVAIRKYVEMCKGMKPVIIVSSQIGDKSELLESLALVLNEMFNNLENDILDFNYIYTKFSTDEHKAREEIVGMLQSIMTSLEESANKRANISECFQIMVTDMLTKAEHGTLILVDPINGNREKILSQLNKSPCRFITNLHDKISDSLSIKSQGKLEAQFNKHYDALKKSMDLFEYPLTIYKFRQLKELNSLLKKKEIGKKFETIVSILIENFKKEYFEVTEDFNRKILKNNLLENDEIDSYMVFMKNIKNSDDLFKEIESSGMENKFEEMKRSLCNAFDLLVENLRKRSLTEESNNIETALTNLKNVAKAYVALELNDENQAINVTSVYADFNESVKQEARKFAESIERYLTSNDFETISKNLTLAKDLASKFQNHFDSSLFRYDEYKLKLMQVMMEKVNLFNRFFNHDDLNDEQLIENLSELKLKIEEVKETVVFFRSASSLLTLHQHIDQNLIIELSSNFKKKISDYYDGLIDKTNGELRLLEENRFLSTEFVEQSMRYFCFICSN